MRSVIKTTILLIGIIFVLNMKNTNVLAFNISTNESHVAAISTKSIFDRARNFINYGKTNQVSGLSEKEVAKEFLPVGRILVLVAIGVLMVVAVIMGIKWITANPEQQAKLKGQLFGLVFSIFVIFGAVGIWEFVKLVMSKLD